MSGYRPFAEDDFFIYLADTQDEAEDLVHSIVKEHFFLGKYNWLEGEGGTVQGLVWTWDEALKYGLGGIHGRVHVWAKADVVTPAMYDVVSNVTSHWLSHVEWV